VQNMFVRLPKHITFPLAREPGVWRTVGEVVSRGLEGSFTSVFHYIITILLIIF
jgi:hypothetical protein